MDTADKRFIVRKEFFGCLVYDRENGEYIPFDKDAGAIFEVSIDNPINTVYDRFSDKFSLKSFNTFIKLCESIELLDENKRFRGAFKDFSSDETHLYSPLRVHLQVTKGCNLNCIHCFSDSGKALKNELKFKEITALIDQMAEIGSYELTVGGGEPFLRSDMLDIIGYAHKAGINLSVSTNATLVNKKLSQKLGKQKLKKMRVSFEGVSQKTYEFLRGKNTYKKALRGLRFLRENCSFPIYLHVTLIKQNLSELPGLIRLAESFDFQGIELNYALPVGRAASASFILSYDEALVVKNMAQKLQRYTRLNMVIPPIPFKTQHRGVYHHFGCIGGTQVCYINSEGYIYPCGFFTSQATKGNIKDTSLKKLWDDAPLIKLFRSFKGNPTCLGCDSYSTCRGGCRARALYTYKNLNAPDPYCPHYHKFNR